jgi:hypothetical protein
MPITILYQFFVLGLVSLAIGLACGLFTSLIFKNAPHLRVNAITQTFLLIAFSVMSYYIANITEIAEIEMSGIISLLACGIV